MRRAGLALTEFFATSREADPYAHAINLQHAGGLFQYRLDGLMQASVSKFGFQWRALLLAAPKGMPFLLAYDFDVLAPPEDAPEFSSEGLTAEQIKLIRESWNLDARVGFYIPKRSYREGIILLNSYKWDWPTIYNAILNYQKDPQVDYFGPLVSDILLTDGNSFYNVERAESTYLATDFELPDDRKFMAVRQSSTPENLTQLTSLLERKFDWGADL